MMFNVVMVAIFGLMAAASICQQRLLARLRTHHPDVYAALGGPTQGQISFGFGPRGWAVRNNISRFIRKREYEALEDPVAARLGKAVNLLAKAFLVVFLAAFLWIMTSRFHG